MKIMKLTIKDGIVSIKLDASELATLDVSLGCFISLAENPRPDHIGDRATKEDLERAKLMEELIFQAYCHLEDSKV